MKKLIALYALLVVFPCLAFASGTSGTGTGTSSTGGNLDSLFGANGTGPNPQFFARTGTNAYTAQNVYVFNKDSALVPNLRKCLQNVKTQQSSCTFYWMGDSTTFGAYSNGSLTGDYVAGSIVTRFTQRLNQVGIPSDSNAVLFDGLGSGQAAQIGQIVQGSSWSSAGHNGDFWGGAAMEATTSTNAFTYTPNVPTDNFNAYYYQNGSGGTMTISVDGTLTATINTTGSFNVVAGNVNPTLGMHTYSIKASIGGVSIGGVYAYNSVKPSIHNFNGGVNSFSSTSFVDLESGLGTTAGFTAVAPKVTFEECGVINDWFTNSVATFKANCQTMITLAKSFGDVILVTANPSPITSISHATQQGYITAMYQLAASNNIPLIDIWSRAPTWEILNTFGEEFTGGGSNLHPNGFGYSDFADQVFQAVMDLTGTGGGISPVAQAPTIASGFGTASLVTSGTTSAFQVNVGTGGTASTGVLTMPTATYGWNCNFHDITTPASFVTDLTATTSTSVSVTNYSRLTGLALAWTASDILSGGCNPN